MSVSTFEGDSLTDINILRKIDKLQSYLEDSLDFKQVYSPVSIYKSMNRIYNGGVSNTYVLPENQSKINKYDKVALKLNRKLYSQFIDSTHTKGRITARIKDIGTTKIKYLNQQTNDWINNNITDNNLKFRTTGSMFLTDKSNDYLIRNMLMSLALAFIIVSILMFLLFMDLKMVIISLIPNILPLFVVAAIIGFKNKVSYQKMMDEFEYNKLIYEATFTFEPIIGKMYHLYKRKNGESFLSIIAPNECNFNFLGSFYLNTDQINRQLVKIEPDISFLRPLSLKADFVPSKRIVGRLYCD